MEEQEINLGEILDSLFMQRWLIAKVAVGVIVLAVIYAILATPIYKSNMLIQIEDKSSTTPTALSNITEIFGGKSEANAEMQILGSRMVVSRVVNNLHLDFEAYPRYFPIIGKWIARGSKSLSKPGFLGMGGYAWGNERIDVTEFGVEPASGEASPDDMKLTLIVGDSGQYVVRGDDLADEVHGKVGEEITFKTMQGLGALKIDKISANTGTQFVLVHHSHLLTVQRLQGALKINEKVKQSDIINVSMEDASPELIANILNEVGQQYLIQNIKRAAENADKTLRFLDRYLPDLKARINKSESSTSKLKAQRGLIDETEQAKAILQTLIIAQGKAADLSVKRDDLLSRYTPQHPAVKAINAQIAAIQDQIASIERQIRKMPDITQAVLERERDDKVDNETYATLLATAQQMRLLKEGSVGNVRIIDHAYIPEVPSKPKRLVILVLSIFGGLFLGVVTALIKKALFGGVESAHEIEDKTGITVYASIPQSKKQEELSTRIQAKEKGVFVLEQIEPDEPSIESLRSFRTALQFSMQDAKNNIVMFTGATPGVGKSFVSINVAATIATAGLRVLLCDLDLRKGHINQYFGLPREEGFSEMLADILSYDKVLHREVIPNLDFISTGRVSQTPHLLLAHGNLKRFLETASKDYDLVVIDTAPLLAVSDGGLIADQAGTIIMVAREGVTTIGDISETVKRFTQSGAKVNGMVLNAVRERPGKYGYGYGKYRYSSYAYKQYTNR